MASSIGSAMVAPMPRRKCRRLSNGYELSPSLQPLAKHREDFTIFSGLHQASVG